MSKNQLKYIIGGLLILGVIVGVFTSLSSENLTYYHTPTEILDNPNKFLGKKVRVMGMIEEGSVQWEPSTTKLSFRITEDGEAFLKVFYIGSKPDMFKEGQGVVVEGKLTNADGTFEAGTLLVKHSEEYKVDPKNKEMQEKMKYYQSSEQSAQ